MITVLEKADIANKQVIVRVDYNVPFKNDEILDTKKIDSSFETIDYLIENNCSIILLSHFGRVKTEEDKASNSSKPVYEYIKSLNKYEIKFCDTPMGEKLDKMADELKEKEVLLVENTRFLDLNGKLESGNDAQLASYWAELGEFYVDDAFGSMHRSHASVTGIPKFLPSAIGFLAEKEVTNLAPIINVKERPFVVIMGGAKLDDKISLIYNLIEKADFLLLGGGIANTFLKAAGFEVGSSMYSKESLEVASSIMQEFPDKIILPKDMIVSPTYSESEYEIKSIKDIVKDDVIGDIGTEAVNNYKKFLDKASLVFVNGTVGIYEKKEFSNGTNEILRIVSNLPCKKIVGGGDAASAVKKFGFEDKMDFISTGGGATLTYIAEGTLPGIEALKSEQENSD